MNYFALLSIGFIVGLTGAMQPGPMLVYTISRSLEGKIGNAVKIVLGHALVEAAVIILITIGLKQILGSGFVVAALSLVGGLSLLIMGARTFVRAGEMRLINVAKTGLSPGLIGAGIFVTVFNPTFPTWWITIGAPLLSRALVSGLFGLIALSLGHWLADFAWFTAVAFLVIKGKRRLNDRKYQMALRLLALPLLGLGAYFFAQGIKALNLKPH